MEKPYLLIVTGRPGAGKTTFAEALGKELWMPVVSRDRMKEGFLHTLGKSHRQISGNVNLRATQIYFDILSCYIRNGISVIAEAAFQHPVWSEMLRPLMDQARVKVIVCQVDGEVALERFLRRGMEDARREYFHGDKGVQMVKQGKKLEVSAYAEPVLGVPTFHVDTSGEYVPSIAELAEKIFASEHTNIQPE